MGAGGIKSLGATKSPMSMGDILDVLVSKAKLEAEDAQRVLLGALNGLAALMLLDTGPTQTALAIKTYREVTCSSQDASFFWDGHVLLGLLLLLWNGANAVGGVRGVVDVANTPLLQCSKAN